MATNTNTDTDTPSGAPPGNYPVSRLHGFDARILVAFHPSQRDAIQAAANRRFGGNFSEAVRVGMKTALETWEQGE